MNLYDFHVRRMNTLRDEVDFCIGGKEGGKENFELLSGNFDIHDEN